MVNKSGMAKRLFDVLASLAGLVILSPLFALIAVAVKLDSPGPVFFRGRRVGRNGRLFDIYKFRSMVVDADRKGPGITTAGDPRITRVGNALRRTKLDELPQLINVVRGEMSLVGPRPEDARYVALYTPEQRRVLSVRPGITSPASLRFRQEEDLLRGEGWRRVYREQVLPAKLQIELDYLEGASLWRDLGILVQTVLALVPRRSDAPK
jgi:lipopolysaccharide/colanic/teichoic acid biosynthesis glycosyltransferase